MFAFCLGESKLSLENQNKKQRKILRTFLSQPSPPSFQDCTAELSQEQNPEMVKEEPRTIREVLKNVDRWALLTDYSAYLTVLQVSRITQAQAKMCQIRKNANGVCLIIQDGMSTTPAFGSNIEWGIFNLRIRFKGKSADGQKMPLVQQDGPQKQLLKTSRAIPLRLDQFDKIIVHIQKEVRFDWLEEVTDALRGADCVLRIVIENPSCDFPTLLKLIQVLALRNYNKGETLLKNVPHITLEMVASQEGVLKSLVLTRRPIQSGSRSEVMQMLSNALMQIQINVSTRHLYRFLEYKLGEHLTIAQYMSMLNRIASATSQETKKELILEGAENLMNAAQMKFLTGTLLEKHFEPTNQSMVNQDISQESEKVYLQALPPILNSSQQTKCSKKLREQDPFNLGRPPRLMHFYDSDSQEEDILIPSPEPNHYQETHFNESSKQESGLAAFVLKLLIEPDKQNDSLSKQSKTTVVSSKVQCRKQPSLIAIPEDLKLSVPTTPQNRGLKLPALNKKFTCRY